MFARIGHRLLLISIKIDLNEIRNQIMHRHEHISWFSAHTCVELLYCSRSIFISPIAKRGTTHLSSLPFYLKGIEGSQAVSLLFRSNAIAFSEECGLDLFLWERHLQHDGLPVSCVAQLFHPFLDNFECVCSVSNTGEIVASENKCLWSYGLSGVPLSGTTASNQY